MKEGHIYISGVIGSTFEDDGVTIKEKGFDLIDLIEQFQALGEDVEKTIIHIDSPGGYVSVGDDMHDFIKSMKNCFTSAENTCASIATEIFLSVPLQNRSIQEGCNFLIHNPFIPEVGGDAAALQNAANAAKEIEEKLESMYVKATGLNKQAVSGLMALETSLTPEQCIKFKFASSITKKEPTNVLALVYNQNIKGMKLSFKQRAANVAAAIKGEALPHPVEIKNEGREAKALVLETEQGNINTAFADIMVGDEALWDDGTPVPDGDYVVTSGAVMDMDVNLNPGFTVVVAEGKIASITPAEGNENNVDAENVMKDLQSKLDAEIAKNTTLTKANTTLTSEAAASKQEAEEVLSQMEELAKLGSNYVAPNAVAHFRDTQNKKKKEKEMTNSSMKERKESYKKK